MFDEAKIYQHIGEFVVSYQWLEDRIRQIGWVLQDPRRQNWPPKGLRTHRTEALIDEVENLFLEALPRCRLEPKLEADYRAQLPEYAKRFHDLRRARNRILHSAYIAFKAGHEIIGLMRSNPKLAFDSENRQPLYDEEMLTDKAFDRELIEIGQLAEFFNRCYVQLIQRPPLD